MHSWLCSWLIDQTSRKHYRKLSPIIRKIVYGPYLNIYPLVVGISGFVHVLWLLLNLAFHHPELGEILVGPQGLRAQFLGYCNVPQYPLQLHRFHKNLHKAVMLIIYSGPLLSMMCTHVPAHTFCVLCTYNGNKDYYSFSVSTLSCLMCCLSVTR